MQPPAPLKAAPEQVCSFAMKAVHSSAHHQHAPQAELSGGRFVPPFDAPVRAEHILAALRAGHFDIRAPTDHGRAPIERVHTTDYLDFLASCWSAWTEAGHQGDAIASVWPSRAMPATRPPRDIEGRMGYYALAAETSICAGTWAAAKAAADVALTAQRFVADGDPAAFALCRPPGHHAASDMFGGYCFINNAAVAAQAFIDAGAQRVAVLDVDFHHGNGTQQIFYRRQDVFFASLHGDPIDTFPYFLGAADERGEGPGEGYNANYPLPLGTDYARWRSALDDALKRLDDYRPDALVISLGVDTFEKDPISAFKLTSDDFRDYGARIAGLQRPTLFVMEGGYALEEIGRNTVNVLEGFLQA